MSLLSRLVPPLSRSAETDVLPPLNARFAAYLDQSAGQKQSLVVWAGWVLFVLGAVCAAIALYAALLQHRSGAGVSVAFGGLLLLRGLHVLQGVRATRATRQEVQNVVRHGVPVTGFLVQANEALFAPGSQSALPALVLFSFQPEVSGDTAYMQSLARRVFSYKNTTPSDGDSQIIAHLTTDERAVRYRRRLLPYSFTDGSTIYCADLWINRAYLKNGHLTSSRVSCLAHPNENGGLEQIPHWLVGAGAVSPPDSSRPSSPRFRRRAV